MFIRLIKACPLETKLVKNLDVEKPYITHETKALLKMKHKLQKQYNKHPVTFGERYRTVRNKVNSEIRTAKRNYFKNKFSYGNTKKRWGVINDLLGRNGAREYTGKFVVDDNETDDPRVIAGGFNDYFSQVGERLNGAFSGNPNYGRYMMNCNGSLSVFYEADISEIEQVVNGLNDSAPGPDCIPIKLFKDNFTDLSDIIRYLCNMSMESGVFPVGLKIAKVTCIYKAGDRGELSNYRPISVLNTFSKIIEKLVNTKKRWGVINDLLGRNGAREYTGKFVVDDNETDDPRVIAGGFNDYFSQVGERLNGAFSGNPNYGRYMMNSNGSLSVFYEADISEIEQVVNGLNDSAPGPDCIPIKLFKDNFTDLSDIIRYLCNMSMESGVFPVGLKIAKVTCIYKAGDRGELSNYRPISVLNTFSKIIEKLVVTRIRKHFVINNFFSSEQFGFRESSSTEDAVQKVVCSLYDGLDGGGVGVGVFLDLAKAFDSINREILLKKLERYGINGTALKWLKSYFQGRTQYVQYHGESSAVQHVNFGVVQGSLLGPLLFIIYVNNIVNCAPDIKFVLYADDTSMFTLSQSLEQSSRVMNRALERVREWLCNNRLTLNVAKTNYVVFRGKRKPVNLGDCELYIGDNQIEAVNCVKFLGVYLDEHLHKYTSF